MERALSGDFFTARKLGFAQQIVSGYVRRRCFFFVFFSNCFFSNPFFSSILFQHLFFQKMAVVFWWLVTGLRVFFSLVKVDL